MPGVSRPYTLTDVLGTINAQTGQGADQQGGGSVSGLGFFAEADENTVITDLVTTSVQLNAGWDQGQWGSVSWV